MSQNTTTDWASLGRQLKNYHLDVAVHLACDFDDVRATFESLASDIATNDLKPLTYRRAYRDRVDVLLNAHKFDQSHSYGAGADEPAPRVCACCQVRYFDLAQFDYPVCPSCMPDECDPPFDYRWGKGLFLADGHHSFEGHECRWEPAPFDLVCASCEAGFDSTSSAPSVCPSCLYDEFDY